MTSSTEPDRRPPAARDDSPGPDADQQLITTVDAIEGEHDVVVAHWRRDEVTVSVGDGSARPLTDLEWAYVRSTLPGQVYGAVHDAQCLRHAAEQALVWAADRGDRQHLHQVLPDVDAVDPAALQAWSAEQRWHQTCEDLDPRLTSDPHYPALVQALERAEAAGADVQTALAAAVTTSLPAEHTGRVLHSRFVQAHPAAAGPPAPRAAPCPAPRR